MNRFHTFRCKYSKLYVLPPDKKQEKSDYCTYIPLINYGGSIERSLHALCLVEMTIEGMISRDDSSGICHVERSREISPRAALGRDDNEDREEPIIINSGYRSPEVNKAVGGVATSNHLTGCAADIRVSGIEQLIRYATILLDISDESQEDFDELLIERSPKGSYWLHFAVRPSGNRRKVRLIQT